MTRNFVMRAALVPALALVASAAASTAATAAEFPTKPITFVVPNPPGGVVDSSARLVSDTVSKILGQPVVIDNKGGASGNIAYGQVARAPKDGYQLLISYSAYHVGNPSLFASMPWKQADFVPVALIGAATNVITINPKLQANNLKDFLAYLKANPGKVNYASQGKGSLSHVGTALFEQTTGTEMTHVPYKGSGQAIQDVLSGQVEVFMTTPPSVIGHIQSGKLKPLAVTSKARHPMLPDVPTTAEAGLPGFELEAWVGLFAPAGTPKDVIDKISAAVQQALETPEVRKRAETLGIEPRYLGPDALAKLVEKDTDYWSKIIKARGITED
ncbi:MAG: tripartite tricarboxylate transporter substrate binding protein [Burkholderiaceae bacterium]